jgi:hypothetical protein
VYREAVALQQLGSTTANGAENLGLAAGCIFVLAFVLALANH